MSTNGSLYSPCSPFSYQAFLVSWQGHCIKSNSEKATAPQLSDSLTETRTYPQISIVSTGLLTAVGTASSMPNYSESLEEKYLLLAGDSTWNPFALDIRWDRIQNWPAALERKGPGQHPWGKGGKEPQSKVMIQSISNKPWARQPSLPATTAICVCRDKQGPIKIPVY